MKNPSNIEQQYWRDSRFPQLELRVSEKSDISYKKHFHDCLSLGILTSGETQLSLSGGAHILQSGDAALIAPLQTHACNPLLGGSRSYYMLYFNQQWVFDQLADYYGCAVNDYCCDRPILRQSALMAQLLWLLFKLQQAFSWSLKLRIEQLLQQVIVRHCQPQLSQKNTATLAQQAHSLLLADIQNPPSMAQLAGHLKCSRETLMRHTKHHFGVSPNVLLNNARIEQARHILRQGRGLAETALCVGYSDQAQFHHSFVKYTASTPGQYQRSVPFFDNTL